MLEDAAANPVASRPRSRRRRRLPIAVAAICWVIVIALAIVALFRIVAWDDLEPFAVLNALTAFVYLPAWVVLVVAAVGRRAFLAGAALLVVLAQIAFLYPELSAAQPVPTWAATAPSLRLLDANVYQGNPSMAGYAGEIEAVRPQLVTMEEASPVDVAQLARAGALADLPYLLEIKRYGSTAFFVASHYPLSDNNVVYFSAGLPLIVQTTLELPSGPQPLWVVHVIAPLSVSFSQWKGELALVDRLLRSRGSAGLLVVGDFNATWGNKGFRAILDTGLTDGAAARGRAFDMTWSQTKPIVPPLVRIDHVLTGPGLTVSQIRTGNGPGSDHRDLIATVALHRAPPRGT
jgi:endonuclease/exonuclease/phosphatase (EEP) superfamily protein YafD